MSRSRNRKFAFAIGAIFLSLMVSLSVAAVVLTSTYGATFHESLSKGRWPSNSYRYNEAMRNFEMTPGISTPMLNQQYYIKTHSLGYRIPRKADAHFAQPGGLLAVGCSFTFGDGVEAEQTFTHIAARSLGLPAYNYGVCSYSYASSILQIEDLEDRGILARLSPSIVVLGSGSWLMGRSVSPFYPTAEIQLAYPYLDKTDERVEIAYPSEFISVRHAVGFATSKAYFEGRSRDVPLDLRKRILLLDTIPRVLWTRVKQRYFKNQMTTAELYAFVLKRLSRVTDRIGARLVIINMPGALRETEIEEGLVRAVDECQCATLVDGYRALTQFNALQAQLFHPDRTAHAVYARALIDSIRSGESDRIRE